MTREEFIRQERDAAIAFYRRHPDDDARAPATYGREYRCPCGFRTDDAGAIYDHGETCRTSTPAPTLRELADHARDYRD